jgi:hypothetical protein
MAILKTSLLVLRLTILGLVEWCATEPVCQQDGMTVATAPHPMGDTIKMDALLQIQSSMKKGATGVSLLAEKSKGSASELEDLDHFTQHLQTYLHDSSASPSSNASSCDLCDARWVFILGLGRTGSTSLLAMMNLIAGAHLAGENFGILRSLRGLEEKAQKISGQKNKAWEHGDIDSNRVLCALQSYIKAIGGFAGSDVMIGFKEIRHRDEQDLDFFKKLFPCGRFIINTRRDVAAQTLAQKALNWTVKSPIEHQTRRMEAWQQANKQVSLLMRLEDNFTTDGFNNMLSWLGVSGCRFTSLAHKNEGEAYTSAHDSSSDGHLEGHCIVR